MGVEIEAGTKALHERDCAALAAKVFPPTTVALMLASKKSSIFEDVALALSGVAPDNIRQSKPSPKEMRSFPSGPRTT